MKLALLAPPHTPPTCPPLGPALLSACLQKKLPDAEISVFDLNLDYYLNAFDAIRGRNFGLRIYKWDEETTASHLGRAVSFFNNWDPADSDLKEYHHWATIFLSFENIFNAFMAEMAEKILSSQTVPQRIVIFFENLIQPVLVTKPDLIGFSILYQHQIVFAALLAKLIKKQSNAKIVVGGAAISVMGTPAKLLHSAISSKKNNSPDIFLKDYFDYLLPGEGESGLYSLCQTNSSADLADVPNLIFFNSNTLQINPPAIHVLETLPHPDFSHFKLGEYLTPEPVLPLMTSRGCPWGKCTFCTHHHSYLNYRTRKIRDCVEEIKFIQKQYNCNVFYFYDEMIPATRFKQLAEQIIEQGVTIHYGAYAKPLKSFTPDLCHLIQRSGCRVLQWGVETGSQRVLDLMKKGTKIHEVENVLSNSAQAGIYNLVFVLFGFPTETTEELQQTLTFLECNRDNIHVLSSGTFVLTEGSQVHREPENFSITKIWERNESSILYPVLDYTVSQGMTSQEVQQHFSNNRTFLNTVSLSSRFGAYREHFLLFATTKD